MGPAVVVAALLGLLTPLAALALVTQATDQRLVALLDADLDTQAREWGRYRAGIRVSDPAALCRAATTWLGQQRDHPASQLQLIQCGDAGLVANHPDLEARAREAAPAPAQGDRPWLLRAPDGFSVATLGTGEELRVLSVPVMDGDRRLGTLRIADSLLPVSRMRGSLRWIALGTGVPLSLLAAGLLALLAHRLTRPLRRVADVAADVAAGDLTQRSSVREGASEVVAVSASFDAMLDRVEESRDRERRFVSSASHELRTPLSVLRMGAESLERFQGIETGRLVRQVDTLNAPVSDLSSTPTSPSRPARTATRRSPSCSRRPPRSSSASTTPRRPTWSASSGRSRRISATPSRASATTSGCTPPTPGRPRRTATR
nr:HAMP domain-containing protein [Nigerium massiliense]